MKKFTFRNFINIFKGVKLPWILLAVILITETAEYLAVIEVASLTENVLSESGAVSYAETTEFVITFAVMTVVEVSIELLSGIASEKINRELRIKLWRKVLTVSPTEYDSIPAGSLVSRITTDTNSASKLFMALIRFIGIAVGFAVCVCDMVAINSGLTLLMAVILPVSFGGAYLYGKLKYRAGIETEESLSATSAYMVERAGNVPFIKSSSEELYEEEKALELFNEQDEAELAVGYADTAYIIIEKLTAILGIVIAFTAGGYAVSAGEASSAEIIAFYLLVKKMTESVSDGVESYGTVRQCIGVMSGISEIAETDSEDTETASQTDVPDGDITVKNLSFGYGKSPVLKEISLVIRKNRITALAGKSGSGKTTLTRLISGIYEIPENSIFSGDRDAKEYGISSWRKAFSEIADDTPIIEGTVRGNIVYGATENITEAEIEYAYEISGYKEITDDTEGLDSYVAPNGANLSSAERRTVLIARAVIRNPKYIILDISDSDLDAKARRVIEKAIDNISEGRTVITVSHGEYDNGKADTVYLLENGKAEKIK